MSAYQPLTFRALTAGSGAEGLAQRALLHGAIRVVAAACVLACAAPAMGAQYEFTYSIATRGSVHADAASFARKIAAIYADGRGWSLDGIVRFREVAHGSDFIVWLAAPSAMQSFGADCSAQWDCRSGRDVIINDMRWQTGSPKWPGSLDDYRTMIVNHETGHWLGLDHAICPASGVPAPIMMQQSKGVGACLPNPWPTATERESVLRMLKARR